MYAAPTTNPFRCARVRKRLKEIDSLLDIIWIPVAVVERDVMENIQRIQGRHALVCWYDSRDPLYQLANKVGQALPYELLGWFNTDVTKANSRPMPCDEMMPVMENWLGKMDNQGHGTLKARMQRIYEENEALQTKRIKDFAEEQGYRAGDIYRQSIRAATRPGALPMVQGTDFGLKAGKQQNLEHAKRHLTRGN